MAMNENNLLYRLFINFCVTTMLGLIMVLLEYTFMGEKTISTKILWYIAASGVIVSLVFEFLFVNVLPLTGNNLKPNILWRNRLISAVVNAVIVSVLGKMILGTKFSFIFLLALSVVFGIAAVIVGGIISDIRNKRSIAEMNRRLKLLNGVKDSYETSDSE